MSLSRLVFVAGYGIRLYRFLIIAFLSTLLRCLDYLKYGGWVRPVQVCSKGMHTFFRVTAVQIVKWWGRFYIHDMIYIAQAISRNIPILKWCLSKTSWFILTSYLCVLRPNLVSRNKSLRCPSADAMHVTNKNILRLYAELHHRYTFTSRALYLHVLNRHCQIFFVRFIERPRG